ncbi:exopolyphosphatase [Brevibacillus thermoruber]|uniref:exopolyphosphatase n=1 Tax=Brevibacillus thermoruber TaxID=33942 RepID=UPI0006900100|nr:exopolyphosphatase [Brevibacillus thermoruber]
MGINMNDTIGVIDLGSNTARLVVYRRDDQGLVYEVENVKRTLRLSSHLRDGRLEREGIEKTLACMRQFQQLLGAYNAATAIGVATAAVRQAANGRELLDAIRAETGLSIRVLSGEEEARYGYLAVVNTMDIDEGVTVDIGGGSTEVTWFSGRRLRESVSFPFGIVTLTRMFLPGDPPADEEMKRLQAYVERQFSGCTWIRDRRCPVIAIGGTARNLAKMHQRSVGYSLGSVHHYAMSAEQVDGVLERARALPWVERRQMPGLSKDRADVILSGIAVFRALLAVVNGRELVVSNKGLRDGVLYETVFGAQPADIREVRRRSVEQFMNRYQVDKRHARHVRTLALALFDQLRELGVVRCGEAEQTWLEAAALLHDVGRAINVYESAEHTFYLLSHVLLLGFTHRERLLIAMIASYKNNKLLQQQMARHSDIVGKADKALAETLGHVILLARTLDRSMTQPITDVRLREDGERIVLECVGSGENLMEYALLEDVLAKVSKAWKRPVGFRAVTRPAD